MAEYMNKKECTVNGCNRPVYGLDYCSPHYRRYKRKGHPGPAEIGVAKYAPDATCAEDGCQEHPTRKSKCYIHYRRDYDRRKAQERAR